MKKIILMALIAALLGGAAWTLQAQEAAQPLSIGPITVPHAFVHAGKDFPKGRYILTLSTDAEHPAFTVQDAAKAPLFEEMAVVKESPRPVRKGFRVKREMLKGQEYYRICVRKGDRMYLLFLLLQKAG